MNRSSTFDPFDPNNRDKRKRRTKAQVVADQLAWESSLDNAFKTVLQEQHWPKIVQGDLLLEDSAGYHDNYYALRRNISSCMQRLGYELEPNPNSKDGRWKAFSKSVSVYKKIGSQGWCLTTLKKELDW